MKRTIPFILAIILCLSILLGCSDVKYKGSLSCVSHVGVDGVTALMDMTEDAQAEIISALNSGEWVDDLTNCGHDYEFTIDNATIRYQSDCGSFNDITNKRAMTLSEEGKANINNVLSVKKNENEDNAEITLQKVTQRILPCKRQTRNSRVDFRRLEIFDILD